MQSHQDMINELFEERMQQVGNIDKVVDYIAELFRNVEIASTAKEAYLEKLNHVHSAVPALKSDTNEDWYFGPAKFDASWNHFRNKMEENDKGFLLEDLDYTSTQIVNLTPNPHKDLEASRGLVVGNVQSGKTNSFTAVAAKLADKEYQIVIVLAGIHNSLRNQTQKRLEKFLTNDSRWFKITDEKSDFNLVSFKEAKDNEAHVGERSNSASSYLHAKNKTSLIVAKKNATVLRKLQKWLEAPNAQKLLKNSWVLVIDDEADQASVESRTINPLIQDILKLVPRSTYIGYTATPFANVFIDPTNTDDLYPRDFIYSLPKGNGYFGAEQLFGIRAVGEGDDSHDGYDMVRIVQPEEEALLRPQHKDDVKSFQAVMTPSLKEAFEWFVLATAARRCRGDYGHSSMLVHTSFQIDVHKSFKEQLFEPFVEDFKFKLEREDTPLLCELETLWNREKSRVDASEWGIESESFSQIRAEVPGVLTDLVVIEDNYKSDVRLSYDGDGEEKGKIVLAIGGNTLSRGLTLEGLVASLFIRPSNTYDTLLQMGRWFGYRPGYEDLPRIWTTAELRSDFRHLSLVEKEMRDDIESYRLSGMTPTEMAVKIRTHDSLRITSKMGAAQPAAISYAGSAIETTLFDNDVTVVKRNFNRGIALINSVSRYRQPNPVGKMMPGSAVLGEKGILFKDVRQAEIIDFIKSYEFSADDRAFDVQLIRDYVNKQMLRGDGMLTKWNVVLRQGRGHHMGDEFEWSIPEISKMKLSVRNPLNDGKNSIVDIYSLRPSADYLIEIDDTKRNGVTDAAKLKRMRVEDPETAGKGLLILYPIDNKGMYASNIRNEDGNPLRNNMADYRFETPILGFTMIFPELSPEDSQSSAVRTTHMSVQYLLPLGSEEIDTSQEMYGEE